MAYQVMAVYLLVAIVGVFVSSTAAYAKPKRGFLFENCPRGTIPANALLDPAVGNILVSCRKAPMPDKCILLDGDDKSQPINCPPNNVFIGRDRQRPICCKLKGIITTDCFKPKILYSLNLGFDFPIPEGYAVVSSFRYGSCTEDPNVFQIEFCKLTQQIPYINTYHWM